MATAESDSSLLGPRYAPEDPTLPQPWKGLIDGSTGLLYYWNPETNVTQYERPASAPPLPPGPPPPVSTPKLAPLPMARAQLPNTSISQPGQQVLPNQQQVSQQQPTQQIPLSQPSQQTIQQPVHQLTYQQLSQQPSNQNPAQQLLHQQPAQQFPQHHLAQHTQQYPHMQLPHMQNQQIPYPQAQKMALHQGQQPHSQQFAHQQGQQVGFERVEEAGIYQGRQSGFPSSVAPHSGGIPSSSGLPVGNTRVQMPQIGSSPGQLQQQVGGVSSVSTQQTGASFTQVQQQMDGIHRQPQVGSGPSIPNQLGQGMVRNPMSTGSPMGVKMGYEEDQRGRTVHEFFTNSSKEVPVMPLQQPKLASIPFIRNQQESITAVIHPQIAPPGHAAAGRLNMAPGYAMPNLPSHVVPSQTFPNAAPMRSSPRMLGSPDLGNLSAVDVYRRQHEVHATGDNVPAPFMTFETTGFPPEILREIQFAGFASPTPIQAQTWPIALEGRDIVAIAKTGSGKTLGYILPAFIHLRRSRNNPQIGPTVLVLAPTRELATQIQDEVIKFGRSSRVSCTCLYGGAPKGPQLKEIERGADVVVATPGRLNDILEMRKINFRQVSFLVLDEADRMLDMGFEPQIRKIVNEIPPRRQTLMYTATWPKEVRKIAGDLLVNPVQVNIGKVDELAANKSITQYIEVVSPMEKQRRLEQILRTQERGSKIIIFCSTKRLCDQLARGIGRTFGAAAIHGDKSQGERDWVLNQFRSGKAPILVATDVAARGLDVKDIRVVINYDFPTGIEDYVHRIGRTGRAGATGLAYTFFCDQDWKYAADLIKVLEGANQRVPPEVREMAARSGPAFSKGRGGLSRWDSNGGRFDSGGSRGGMRDGGGGFGGRGGRNDFFGGRGNRGRGGFGGLGGRGRNDRGPLDRHSNMDGRGRYDSRRGIGERNRDRSYSPSPERVRTWGYDRSRSPSRSRSRSRSYSRSRSRSYDRFDRPQPQRRNLFQAPPGPGSETTAIAGHSSTLARVMSPMSPGRNTSSLPKNEQADMIPVPENARPSLPEPVT